MITAHYTFFLRSLIFVSLIVISLLFQVFVLLHQLLIFSLGRILPEQPPINPPADISENSRAKTASVDALGPKPGTELRLGPFPIWLVCVLYNGIKFKFKYYWHVQLKKRKKKLLLACHSDTLYCKSHKFIVSKSLWLLSYAVDAVPCRIAFERGKERHFYFLPISFGTSGWAVLAEELPLKQHYGIVRVAAPLAGSNVCIYT